MIPSNFRGIVMIGTAESQTSLHPLVHTLHIFQEVYHIQSPNKDARKEVSSLPIMPINWLSFQSDIGKPGGTTTHELTRCYLRSRRPSELCYDFDAHRRLLSHRSTGSCYPYSAAGC